MQLQGNIFITGGAGYLGRGIMRRARRESWPCRITVYSRDETKQDVCRQLYPEHRYILGDIRDRDRLETTMIGHDIVIHAGAIKYVPEAEYNVEETLKVNLDGSRNVIQAARKAGIRQCVGISTDKATTPVNTYGASKMLMERAFSEVDCDTVYKCVRYGNVVGSTGSVIPFFQRQRRDLGRLTVTDPEMTRFWMSVDEAIDTILFALEYGTSGGIIVPRPRSMSIGALADVIADGMPIDHIGARPGEKVHEELIHYQESVRVKTHNRDYYELLPVRKGYTGSEPFMVSSLYAERIVPEEMVLMIEDAVMV